MKEIWLPAQAGIIVAELSKGEGETTVSVTQQIAFEKQQVDLKTGFSKEAKES